MNNNLSGFYTSTGVARDIYLPCGVDTFELFVQGSAAGDNWNSVANPHVIKKALWMNGMVAGTALATYNTAGAGTDESVFVATDGFTPIYPAIQAAFPIQAIATGISRASPAVVTSAAHGIQTGDLVRITGTTAMPNLNGMIFTATRTGVNTFTIPIDTSTAVTPAAATDGFFQRVLPVEMRPDRLVITNITQAANAVISTATAHNYTVGALVRINVPTGYGMTQMNGLLGTVTAIGATSITVNIDSTGFTAFTILPLAVAGMSFTRAEVVPVGEISTVLTNSLRNYDTNYMHVGATVVGANGALVLWKATTSIVLNPVAIP